MNLDVWYLMDIGLSEQLLLDILQYMFDISKYRMKGEVSSKYATEITDLIITLREIAFKTTSRAIYLNANLIFEQRRYISKKRRFDPHILDRRSSNEVQLYTDYFGDSNKKKWIDVRQANENDMILHLDTKFNRHANKVTQTRDIFIKYFLQNHGSILQQLHLSVCSLVEPNLSMAHYYGIEDLCTIKSLEESVLEYCNHLVFLNLSWMDLRGKGSMKNPTINTTITKLNVGHASINATSLSQLMLRLPSLQWLYVHNCLLLNGTVDDKVNKPAKITMRDISLDMLHLVWAGGYAHTWETQFSTLQLKIHLTSDAGSSLRKKFQYYGLDNTKMKTITAEK